MKIRDRNILGFLILAQALLLVISFTLQSTALLEIWLVLLFVTIAYGVVLLKDAIVRKINSSKKEDEDVNPPNESNLLSFSSVNVFTKYCPNCGTPIPFFQDFCDRCGASVRAKESNIEQLKKARIPFNIDEARKAYLNGEIRRCVSCNRLINSDFRVCPFCFAWQYDLPHVWKYDDKIRPHMFLPKPNDKIVNKIRFIPKFYIDAFDIVIAQTQSFTKYQTTLLYVSLLNRIISNEINKERTSRIKKSLIQDAFSKISYYDTSNLKRIDDAWTDPYKFEEYCTKLLIDNEYNAMTTKKSGDYGADIIAQRDGARFAFQCKLYSNTVGVDAIYQIHAAKDYYNCDIAVVISTGKYTAQAYEVANKIGVKLWGIKDLERLGAIVPAYIKDRL